MSAKFSAFRDASAAIGMVMLARSVAAAATGKLLVFLHVASKQRALQSELEGALPGVAVTAVGRVGDFERALKAGQDAVLTLPVVLAANGLSPDLRGFQKGAAEERYSLIAADIVPDPARVATVGALDLLGREGTTSFVHSVLGSTPRVERVTKFEDLLPLLQMRRVEAILLPSRLVPELREASRLTLAQWELPKRVALPACAKKGPLGAQVLLQVSKLPQALSKNFGVDEWR